jgi:hypothetical protein
LLKFSFVNGPACVNVDVWSKANTTSNSFNVNSTNNDNIESTAISTADLRTPELR